MATRSPYTGSVRRLPSSPGPVGAVHWVQCCPSRWRRPRLPGTNLQPLVTVEWCAFAGIAALSWCAEISRVPSGRPASIERTRHAP